MYVGVPDDVRAAIGEDLDAIAHDVPGPADRAEFEAELQILRGARARLSGDAADPAGVQEPLAMAAI
jgi:hypothetical protein